MKIFENMLRAAEYARVVYVFTAPAGTTPEQLLEPETYAHVTGKLKADDRIEITAEDRSWFAEIMVLAVNGPLIQVACLRKLEFEKIAGKEHDAYDVEWAGPSAKWRVMRKSDRAVMVKELAAKSDGVAWIEANTGKPVEPLKQAA